LCEVVLIDERIYDVVNLGFIYSTISLVQMGHFYQIGVVYDLFMEGKLPIELKILLIMHIYVYALCRLVRRPNCSLSKCQNWLWQRGKGYILVGRAIPSLGKLGFLTL